MTDGGTAPGAVAESGSVNGGGGSGGDPDAGARTGKGWPYWPAVAVGIVGLLVTGVLVWISASTYSSNENRILKYRVRDAGALLTSSLPNIQTPLASAAALADATNGDTGKFDKFIAPSVGPSGGRHQYVSVSLWRLGAARPLAVIGVAPELAASAGRVQPFFAQAAQNGQLSVIGLLSAPQARLGYAVTSPGLTGRYVVYGESALPADRHSRYQSSSTFTDLDYALYLGRSQSSTNLLVSDLKKLPITGRHATISTPFGDNALTFVVTPRQPLTGTFAQRLPWFIAIAGLLLSLGAAALTARLIDRRNQAMRLARSLERIAEENRRLYAEQRTIAQTLQHALLPERLPKISGVETSARYEAGVKGVDVGGDWYDLIALDDRRLLLVVGDVSGRGVRAAATMASLRFAIQAYAAENNPPEEILTKVSKLVNVKRSGQFATVLCAVVDVEARRLTVTSAGHLPPLLISDGSGTFVQSKVGVPIGVQSSARYTSTSIDAPPAATLLAFTDGLVERRGESIDAGLARLQRAASSNHVQLDELLNRLLEDVRRDGGDDDTAIAALRWLE